MAVIDIIILLLVGLFVVSRFFSFRLPKDGRSRAMRKADFARLFQRHIPAEPKDGGVVADAPRKKELARISPPAVKKVSAKDLAGLSGLEKIKAMEPGFSEKKFLDGAKTAYRYFYTCWNARDEDGLGELCAPRLVDSVVAGWEDGWRRIEVEEIVSAEVGEARVNGRTALVEAVIEARLKDGRSVRKVVSRWLLARAIGSDEPNWELQDMREGRA